MTEGRSQRWTARPRPPGWLGWPWWGHRAGLVTLEDARLAWHPADDAPVEVTPGRALSVQLHVWPLDRRRGLLSARLVQGHQRIELQTTLPWSSIPPDLPLLQSSAPWLAPDAFMALWAHLTRTQASVGQDLPALSPGRWPATPREVPVPDPAPVWSRPLRLRDMPWFGTRHAIFTFGVNTRGFIVVGVNIHGFIAVGVNAVGTVAIGVNTLGTALAAGINTLAPLSLGGFNLLALLTLIEPFNAPLDWLGHEVPALLFPIGALMAAALWALAGNRRKAAEVAATLGPTEPIAPGVIDRWNSRGARVGAALAVALPALLWFVPIERLQLSIEALLGR